MLLDAVNFVGEPEKLKSLFAVFILFIDVNKWMESLIFNTRLWEPVVSFFLIHFPFRFYFQHFHSMLMELFTLSGLKGRQHEYTQAASLSRQKFLN